MWRLVSYVTIQLKTFVSGSEIFSCIWFMLHHSRTTARRWCGFMTLPGVLMTSLTVVHGDCHLWDISTYSSKSGMSSFTSLRTVLLFTYFGHVWHSSFHSTASSAATPVWQYRCLQEVVFHFFVNWKWQCAEYLCIIVFDCRKHFLPFE